MIALASFTDRARGVLHRIVQAEAAKQRRDELAGAAQLAKDAGAAGTRAAAERASWAPKIEKARQLAERAREAAHGAEADLARVQRDAGAAIYTHEHAATRAAAEAARLLRPHLAQHREALDAEAQRLRTAAGESKLLEDGRTVRTTKRSALRRLDAALAIIARLDNDPCSFLPDLDAGVAALVDALPPVTEEDLTRDEYAELHRTNRRRFGGAA